MFFRYLIILLCSFILFIVIDLSLSFNRPSFFSLPNQLQFKLMIIVFFFSLVLWGVNEFFFPFLKRRFIKKIKSYYSSAIISDCGYTLTVKHEQLFNLIIKTQPSIIKKDELVIKYYGNDFDSIQFLNIFFDLKKTPKGEVISYYKTIDFNTTSQILNEIDKILSFKFK